MYPRSAAPRGRSAYSNGLYPPAPAPRCYDYNHQSLAGVNRLDRLPPYEWKPPPSSSSVPTLHTPNMTNVRKRRNAEYSPHGVKRQRFDSSSHPLIGSPLIQAHPPPAHPGHMVAGSSRSSFVGLDSSYSSPQVHSHSQVPVVPQSSNSLQTYAKDKLSDQMVELFEACQQQTSDLAQKEMCRVRLQQDIQRVYAVARLYLTGSSMNGLGCRSSDADLCLVLKGNRKHDPIYVLSVLQRLFKTLSYVERTQLIRAKVPILRFREKGSSLEFDLNVNNIVGIRNTFLLRSYAYADLRVRPMILVIKKWAQHKQINDASKGTLSSYTLVLMVLHYLQTLNEPVLPSLQCDYPECFNPLVDIDMVPEGSKHVPPYISRNHSSLGELLLGFLRYYATDFRWDKQVISVREGRALPKTNSQGWRNKYICVEEPFERNNVARAVHEKMKFDAIKAQFAESCRILHERKDLNSILPVRAIINKESSRR
ncbi:poly(A) RNA polymerase GLD2 [Mastacembelus armatus]|uniref:polynucleotide adenylyltransferase n=1 Tax=Mastacembelus armatus TaxID=205130 RepID=A0A3Q3ME75_9TELE|nr:poly(A) RNA polymerase GLD2 [Mastacembelus armatus]XP_026178250.1 poly(A) RNA polymerase GLD2 [Mastacembelus armatus]